MCGQPGEACLQQEGTASWSLRKLHRAAASCLPCTGTARSGSHLKMGRDDEKVRADDVHAVCDTVRAGVVPDRARILLAAVHSDDVVARAGHGHRVAPAAGKGVHRDALLSHDACGKVRSGQVRLAGRVQSAA